MFALHALRSSNRGPSASPTMLKLETLEDRLVPAATATAVTGLSVAQGYTLFNEQEAVYVQVGALNPSSAAAASVNAGTVTITDSGQTKTVAVNNGFASATFQFSLFNEPFQAHAISATYSGATNTAGITFASDNTGQTIQTPDTTLYYLLQLETDAALLKAFMGNSSSMSSSGGMSTTSTSSMGSGGNNGSSSNDSM